MEGRWIWAHVVREHSPPEQGSMTIKTVYPWWQKPPQQLLTWCYQESASLGQSYGQPLTLKGLSPVTNLYKPCFSLPWLHSTANW